MNKCILCKSLFETEFLIGFKKESCYKEMLNLFSDELLKKHLNTSTNHIIFMNNELKNNSIPVEESSFVKHIENTCFSKNVSGNSTITFKVNVTTSHLNIILISTELNVINLILNIQKSVNINLIFLNVTVNSGICLNITKNLSDNIKVNTFWKDCSSSTTIYNEKTPVYTNKLFINNISFLNKDAEINENFNFGVSVQHISLKNTYVSNESNNKVETSHLAMPALSYVLEEEHRLIDSQAKTIFRGVFLQNFISKDLLDKIVCFVRIFSSMNNTSNIEQDIKICNDIKQANITVKNEVLANNELQTGSHGYTITDNFYDAEMMFFFNTFGIDNDVSNLLSFCSFVMLVYKGDLTSFLSTTYNRMKESKNT